MAIDTATRKHCRSGRQRGSGGKPAAGRSAHVRAPGESAARAGETCVGRVRVTKCRRCVRGVLGMRERMEGLRGRLPVEAAGGMWAKPGVTRRRARCGRAGVCCDVQCHACSCSCASQTEADQSGAGPILTIRAAKARWAKRAGQAAMAKGPRARGGWCCWLRLRLLAGGRRKSVGRS